MSSAGDLNNDGFVDIILGAPGATNGAGKAYVMFGHNHTFLPSVSVSNLTYINGFSVFADESHLSTCVGFSVSGTGYVNDDGIDDILIGAPEAFYKTGYAYMIYGQKVGFGSEFNISSLNVSTGKIFVGVNNGDAFGSSIACAGDINNDKIDDIIVGAPSGFSSSGQTYVVFGEESILSVQSKIS